MGWDRYYRVECFSWIKYPRRVSCLSWSQPGPGKFKGEFFKILVPNRTAALRYRQRGGDRMRGSAGGQLLRRPSAARFHCDTLSAIMRVDFIAAWLSWA